MMSTGISHVLDGADWLNLFLQYLMLSLMSFGGVTTTTPELQRFLVEQHQWMTADQFSAYFAIARAAPGPNVMFFGLIGWGVGLNSGGVLMGLGGVVLSLVGILLPSTTLTYLASRWVSANNTRRSVQAFKHGMAPMVIALMLSTGCVLAADSQHVGSSGPYWALVAATALIVLRTKVHLLWLLAGGAILGWVGWI